MSMHPNRKPFVQSRDETNLYVQDWGSGRPIVFLSAWTFDSTTWGEYINALIARGHRCVAPDRRGHGRSDAPCHGYDLDTLADDVGAVFEQRDLHDAILVGYSMGSIEAARYLARQGAGRVKKLILIAPTTPSLAQTADNPDGVPVELIEAQNRAIGDDFSRWLSENEAPFFTEATLAKTRSWIMMMMLGVALPIALACRDTIGKADVRGDLARLDMPTLIVQGDNDASAPLPLTGAKTQNLISGSRLIVYEGAPHGLPLTHRERLLNDIVSFIDS
jgi:non-heme chloroperoxidase